MKAILVIVFLGLIGLAYAQVYVAPIYTGTINQGCTQPNSTYISCPDGTNITIGITVSAPDNPILGNYTVWQIGNENLQAALNSFGNECMVGYGQTATCFIRMPAFLAFSGNGTGNYSIELKIIPSGYPQDSYTENISMTINHYLKGPDAAVIAAYQSAYSEYTVKNNAYGYACTDFFICNSSINNDLVFVNRTLSGARQSIDSGNFNNSELNISFASTELDNSNATFTSFSSYAEVVVKDVVSSKADISNAIDTFLNNTVVLENCTSSNKTNAVEYLSGKLDTAKSMLQPITTSGAQTYSQFAQGLSSNVSSVVNSCKKSGTFSTSTGFSLSLSGLNFNIGPTAEYIIIAVVIIIIVMYLRSMFMTRSEMRKIREEHGWNDGGNEHKGTEGHNDKSSVKHNQPENNDEKPEEIESGDFVQKISKGSNK